MTSIRHRAEPDLADRRRLVARALRPFVEGTAPGMSSWLLTVTRVAATARDAAEAVLPLLGAPARSPHRGCGAVRPPHMLARNEIRAAVCAK